MLTGTKFVAEYYERDKSKKDKEWAQLIVTHLRTFMTTPIVSRERATLNRQYLHSTQSMQKHKDKFKNPDKMPFKFEPLALFEKFKNILTAEREKADIYINLNSIDPSIKGDKDYDLKLLKGKGFIEGIMSYLQTGIGLPPYKLMEDKDQDGKKMSKGNLSQFNDMSLNAADADDVAFFFKTYYRLDIEIQAEEIVNYFVKYKELREFLKYWCYDVLAVKAIAGRVYANEFTFMPDYRYIKPENVYAIKGLRNDFKDAKAILHEENITIHDAFARIGAELTDAELYQVMHGVNFRHSTSYDGIDYGHYKYPERSENAIGYNELMNMTIGCGYIEWKSMNNDARKEGKTEDLGNFKSIPVKPDYKVESPNYKKVNNFYQTTYKCYYITTSSNQQRIYKFGELFDQATEGADDEYSNFSFQLYVEPGPSAVEVAMPHIDTIHDAYFRAVWVLNKAKPKGTRYNYNVVAKIATQMYKGEGMNERSAVMKYIRSMADSIDDFYVNDTLNPNVGGGQNPHFDKPNGIDKVLVELYDVMTKEEGNISSKLAINSIREAYSPSPNDGYKLQMQTLAQSRNATEYMSRMIMSVLENFAKHTLQVVQDLIHLYPERAKRVLTKALGKEAVELMSNFERIGLHKFGIFIDTFNTDIERNQEKKNAYDAWNNKEIDYQTYLLISSIDNWKRAAQILAYEKNKAEKIKEKQMVMMEEQKRMTDNNKAMIDANMAKLKGSIEMAKQKVANAGPVEVANINGQVEIKKKQMTIDAEPEKAGVRTDAKVKELNAKQDIEERKSLV